MREEGRGGRIWSNLSPKERKERRGGRLLIGWLKCWPRVKVLIFKGNESIDLLYSPKS